MKATVYKIELCAIDFEDYGGQEDIVFLIENIKNLYPKVMSIQSRKIDEWDDDHPLNQRDTHKQAYEELFSDKDLKDA
jgi:hypothetical protein